MHATILDNLPNHYMNALTENAYYEADANRQNISSDKITSFQIASIFTSRQIYAFRGLTLMDRVNILPVSMQEKKPRHHCCMMPVLIPLKAPNLHARIIYSRH
jgi:hypothetical protein